MQLLIWKGKGLLDMWLSCDWHVTVMWLSRDCPLSTVLLLQGLRLCRVIGHPLAFKRLKGAKLRSLVVRVKGHTCACIDVVADLQGSFACFGRSLGHLLFCSWNWNQIYSLSFKFEKWIWQVVDYGNSYESLMEKCDNKYWWRVALW